ncbi:MAG: type II toxin-antitoxin system VapC family toxin [Myxococcaceae bacterium]
MRYLLDTYICIYALNCRSEELVRHLQTLEPSDIGLSVMTVAELRYGASYSSYPVQNHSRLDDFLSPFRIISWDEDAANCYGELVADLRRKGTPIGPIDALIAAHALSLELVLVTNNTKEFERVPGLVCENWTRH